MMAVFLKEPDIIGGIPRNAGELVVVPDDYDQDNISQTVRRNVEQFHEQEQITRRQEVENKREERQRGKRFKVGLTKLQEVLQADYSQFWNKLSNRPALLDRIIEEMRADTSILQHALDDPQWFVNEVTKRFGQNGRQ